MLAPASRDADLLAALSCCFFVIGTVVFVLILAALMLAIFHRGPRLSSRRAWAMVIVGGVASPALAGIGVTVSGIAIGMRPRPGLTRPTWSWR